MITEDLEDAAAMKQCHAEEQGPDDTTSPSQRSSPFVDCPFTKILLYKRR